MNAKQRAISSKEPWKAMRARYTWHLRTPFQDEFDRSHWWKDEDDVEPVAALYELARRHPRIGQLRSKLHDASWYGQELRRPLIGATEKKMASQAFDDLGQEPKAIHCLCLIGLKSWPTLDWRNQEYWEMSAGKMKGVDCRHEIEKCGSITLMAYGEIFTKRARSLKLGRPAFQFRVGAGSKTTKETNVAPVHPQAFHKAKELVAKQIQKNPISSAEMETAITNEAVGAHRNGHLLLSIAPDLTVDEAKVLLEREYREHQKRNPEIKQRASFARNWIDVISEFEECELKCNGAKSDVFTSYRRVVDGIRF